MGNIILFAIIGAVFYYIFKSYGSYTSEYSKKAFKNMTITKESIGNSELGMFVALVAKLAKADGKVDALEAELVGIMFDDISAVYPEPEKTKKILKEIFAEQKDIPHNLQAVAEDLANTIHQDRQKQQQFMGFLIQLAFVDGEVSESEDEMLQTIAAAFNFDPNAYHAIFNQFEKMIKNIRPKANISDAYKLLGLNENDEMQVVKKAYRKLVRQYHPDIIKSQNKGEKYMQEATAKTQEINQAYEMIKEARKR